MKGFHANVFVAAAASATVTRTVFGLVHWANACLMAEIISPDCEPFRKVRVQGVNAEGSRVVAGALCSGRAQRAWRADVPEATRQ